MDEVLYVVPSQSCQTEGEDDEPKVYISTTTGFKKVERKHSQNSDRYMDGLGLQSISISYLIKSFLEVIFQVEVHSWKRLKSIVVSKLP